MHGWKLAGKWRAEIWAAYLAKGMKTTLFKYKTPIIILVVGQWMSTMELCCSNWFTLDEQQNTYKMLLYLIAMDTELLISEWYNFICWAPFLLGWVYLQGWIGKFLTLWSSRSQYLHFAWLHRQLRHRIFTYNPRIMTSKGRHRN